MPQITLDAQAIHSESFANAQIELHNYLENQVQQVAPTCSRCKYFTASKNLGVFLVELYGVSLNVLF